MRVETKTFGFAKAGLHLRQLREGLSGGTSAKALRRAAEDIGKEALKIVREETKSAYPGGSGRLLRSWRAVRSQASNNLVNVSVVSSVPYARIRDTGGTIRPKRTKYLTVPIHPAAKGRRARSFANTFSKRQMIWIRHSREHATPIYSLESQVTVQGSGYLQKAQRRVRRYVVNRTGKAIRELSAGIYRG